MIDYLIITNGIKGMPNHFLCEGGVYQKSYCPRKRTMPEQVIKKIRNGLCRGFKIDGRFYSLTALEKRSYPVTRIVYNVPDECPF